MADYNLTVLALVTLPNLLLSWAQQTFSPSSWEAEGELELDATNIQSFLQTLSSFNISLSFFSGAWSSEFVTLVIEQMSNPSADLTIVGAETIYSPTALRSFADTTMDLLDKLQDERRTALVAAKLVYFGVGGSMEDFCVLVRARGWIVERIREESEGVRRATVEVKISVP